MWKVKIYNPFFVKKIILLLLSLLFFSFSSSEVALVTVSKGKQKKYFPEIIKEKNICFGLKEEKFLKKVPNATIEKTNFDFRKVYIETFELGNIENISYYFTTKEYPQLYEFIIKY